MELSAIFSLIFAHIQPHHNHSGNFQTTSSQENENEYRWKGKKSVEKVFKVRVIAETAKNDAEEEGKKLKIYDFSLVSESTLVSS